MKGRHAVVVLSATLVLGCESELHSKCQSVIDSLVECGIMVGWDESYVEDDFADECEEVTLSRGCEAELDATIACQESGSCCDPEYFAWGDCLAGR